MNKTIIHMLIWSGVMGVFYFSLIPSASSGYGYMGHRGYHRSHSYWYWGGPNTYYNRNIRSGSVSGAGVRGGGPGSGK